MKIAFLIPAMSLGGAEVFIANLINILVDYNKVDSIILCVYSARNEKGICLNRIKKSSKIKTVILNEEIKYGRLSHLKVLYKLYNMLSKEKPDVINTHLGVANDVALLYPFLRKMKFFHTVHSQALKEIGIKTTKSVYFYIRKYYYTRKNVKLISIANSVKLSVDKYFNLDSLLILNGSVKTEKSDEFSNVLEKISILKKSNNTKVFLSVGNLRPAKNYPLLVKVFKKLYKEEYDCLLIVLGDSTMECQIEEFGEVKNKNIYFLGGVTNVQDYMQNADFLCMSSLYEGMPITLIEAFSQKLVPIVTPAPGIVDMVSANYNGIISEKIDEESYYKAVIKAMNITDQEKKRFQENAYNDYKAKYDISITAKKYLKHFQLTKKL